MSEDTALAALRIRLGPDAFEARLRAERALVPRGRFADSPRVVAAKMLLSSRFIRFCFRITGLHARGYRQFLDVRIVDHEVRLPGLPPGLDGFTLLQLSDLHLDLDDRFVPALAARLAAVAYDVAVITGDFRNLTRGRPEPSIAEMRALLTHLRPPVFAVLGNHDMLAMVPPLEQAGLRFLLNEHVVLDRGGGRLVLAGVDDARYYGTHDVARALAGAPAEATRVLLSHAPSVHREAAANGVHLMLAGHTHGGQICLPGGHIVLRSDRSPRAFLRGPWRFGATIGYTSPGTGSCGTPLRFHCPPEATRHILKG